MKVRLVVTVDVDPTKWERKYGMAPSNGELWSYFYEDLDRAICDSGAKYTIKEVKIR